MVVYSGMAYVHVLTFKQSYYNGSWPSALGRYGCPQANTKSIPLKKSLTYKYSCVLHNVPTCTMYEIQVLNKYEI